ncbi:MAG TPA: hypothetical protein VGE72_16455 [Azospirillum sp.]
MIAPKFHVGQLVHFSQKGLGRTQPHGDFRIERLLPIEQGELQYRIKSVADGRERVVRETELGDQMMIETLAQTLYEADNSTGVPWARRDRTVRDAWLAAARRRTAAEPPAA